MGIDRTATSVRVAVVRSAYRKLAIEALREERLADHETPSAAIRAATANLRPDAVATSLSGSRTFVRQLGLPAAAQKELSSVLSFEVEATLPLELEDAVMDHRVLRRIPSDPSDTLPILAGVAKTEEVRDEIGLVLRGAGQEPQRIGIGALPLANWAPVAPELESADVSAILELDDEHTDLLIMRRGEPRLSRSLGRGVLSLPAGAPELGRELRQTLAAWRVQGGPMLEQLIVVGSGRQTPGLESFMEQQLGVKVVDLPKVPFEALTTDHAAALPRFAKAVALALGLSRRANDLNLRQGPVAAQQSYQFVREKTPILVGLAAAIVASFGFSIFAEKRALESEAVMLEEQLEQTTQSTFGEKTSDVKAASALLDGAIGGKSADAIPSMDAFDVLVALSERIPKEITHDIAEFDYNRGAVVIQGIVPTIDDAHTIADKMGEHECFHDVTISRTTRLKNVDKQKYTLEFNVKCGVKKKGEDKSAEGKTSGSAAPKGKEAPEAEDE
jgi:general secretion pathway protein L